jgi:AraC family transcriptional regulator, positive regulator of tynA and feaB
MRALHYRSTEDVVSDQRVRYWRDSVHQSVVEMDLIPTGQREFFGRIELCPLKRIVPFQVQGSPQRVSRDPVEIARGDKNAYYLISQPRSPWRVRHAGQDHFVQPGESVLVDSRVPYEFTFGAGLDDLSVEMPIEWLEFWVRDPAKLVGTPIQASAGWGLALRGTKEALVPGVLAGLPLPDELVEDQLGALLALACGSERLPGGVSGDLFERAVEAIRAGLSVPGLVASDIAVECGVSLRSLHRAFAGHRRSFAGMLMQLRIDEATRMLVDRRFGHLTLAEIGRRCGFLDGSHFARQFRRLRQIGPRDFRVSARP